MSSDVEKALIVGTLIVQASGNHYYTNTEVSNRDGVLHDKCNRLQLLAHSAISITQNLKIIKYDYYSFCHYDYSK